MIVLKYQQFNFSVEDSKIDFFARYGAYEPYQSIFKAILSTYGFYKDDDYFCFSQDSFQDKSNLCDIEIRLSKAIAEATKVLDFYASLKEEQKKLKEIREE